MQLFSMYYFTYSRHYGDLTTIVPEASWMEKEPSKLTESKLGGNNEEYLPECPPPQSDARTQQMSSGTRWESFTKGFPYSTPTADDAQFNFSGDLVDPYEPFPHHP